MRLNIIAKMVLATLVTSGMSIAAHADDKVDFATNITAEKSVCNFTVKPITSTAISATFKYTQSDMDSGANGTMTMDTTTPAMVLVSSGSHTCPLVPFTLKFGSFSKTSAIGASFSDYWGIDTGDGGFIPTSVFYTEASSYTKPDGTGDQFPTPFSLNGNIDLVSEVDAAPAPPELYEITTLIPRFAYSSGDNARIPAVANFRSGHFKSVDTGDYLNETCGSTDDDEATGCAGAAQVHGRNRPSTQTSSASLVTPPAAARSVAVGIGVMLAKTIYGLTTHEPNPLAAADGAALQTSTTVVITSM